MVKTNQPLLFKNKETKEYTCQMGEFFIFYSFSSIRQLGLNLKPESKMLLQGLLNVPLVVYASLLLICYAYACLDFFLMFIFSYWKKDKMRYFM